MNRTPTSTDRPLSVRAALIEPLWRPALWLDEWNWKAALGSAVMRALIFFAVNLTSHIGAALAALQTEFLYRIVASGFYGGLTERLARAAPARRATWVALIVLPALAHIVEFAVHRAAGTVVLGPSIVGSVLFSVVSTRFNLFAMRQGAFIVGATRRSLRSDLCRLPHLAVAFARSIAAPTCRSEPFI